MKALALLSLALSFSALATTNSELVNRARSATNNQCLVTSEQNVSTVTIKNGRAVHLVACDNAHASKLSVAFIEDATGNLFDVKLTTHRVSRGRNHLIAIKQIKLLPGVSVNANGRIQTVDNTVNDQREKAIGLYDMVSSEDGTLSYTLSSYTVDNRIDGINNPHNVFVSEAYRQELRRAGQNP